MKRLIALGGVLLILAGCAQEGATPEQRDLGDFVLGHNIVVARDLQKGPTSRNASAEELTASVKAALDKRLGKYEGERLVHLGVNIGAYVLARPGLPLVYTPKSVFIVNVTVWDDREGAKFYDEPKQIVAFEQFGGTPILGSGLTKSRDEQIAALSESTARQIESWLAKNAVCMTETPTERQLSECWKKPDNPPNSE